MEYASHSPAYAAAWSEWQTVTGCEIPRAYAYVPDRTTAVVGLSQRIERELNLDVCLADGIRLMRRASGGGAVILCDGVLCFGVIMPIVEGKRVSGIHVAFREQTAHVIDALSEFGIYAEHAGISDIAACVKSGDTAQTYKLAGTAQLRKKHAVLVHGSLLVQADLLALGRYLAFPSESPDYRGGRDHASFCRTVAELGSEPVTIRQMCSHIREQAETRGWVWTAVPEVLPAEAEKLLREKYERADWTLHRRRD